MGTIASQTVKGLVLGLLLGAMVWQGGFEEPQAQAQHLTPYHHTGFVAGVPVGYGWYSWWSFPVVVPYGYSYYGYWNYAPRYATFGAISYSWAEDRAGVAWGMNSRWGALRASNRYCAAEDCHGVVWVQGGCAAIAVSREAEKLTFAYNTTRFSAQRHAMRACRRGGTDGCEAKAWVCSF